jgi:hypothetical protein
VIGFEDYQVLVNSVFSSSVSDLPNGEISYTMSEYTGDTQDIRNCVAIHIDPFYFPHIPLPTTGPDFFYDRRVYLQFPQIPYTESTIAYNNKAFHFELAVDSPNSLAVRLVPTSGSYYFKRPINSISELRMRFMIGSNLRRIPIPLASISLSAVPLSNPARFNLLFGDATYIFGPVGLLATPVVITITGFNSGNGGLDSAISSIYGVYATTVISTTQIELAAFNFAAIAVPVSAIATVEKNKVSMQLRFTCLRQTITNSIDVVHV